MRRHLAIVTTATLLLGLAAPAGAATGQDTADVLPATPLPLGPAGLTETRETTEVAPGLTLTTIRRGAPSPDDVWTVHVNLPDTVGGDAATATAALGTREIALDVAARLRQEGETPRVEEVTGPDFADVPGGTVGHAVRIGRYTTEEDAASALRRVRAAGFAATTRYTAQDGGTTSGPWRVHVLTIDFDRFDGRLVPSHGPTLAGTETLSELVVEQDALAGVNAQWFYDDAPAGLYAVDGELLGAATDGRAGLRLTDGGRAAEIGAYRTELSVRSRGATREIDGVNRLPGVIRNCGGVGGDLPTQRPQHDRTCTDPGELVRFTPDYGPDSPAGDDGVEAVLDGKGRVVTLAPARGTAIPEEGSTLQGIGDGAQWLRDNARPGSRLKITERVEDRSGRRVRIGPDTSVIQVGPTLVRGGEPWVDAYADGLVHEGTDATFYYNWVLRRNPRSMVGVDGEGRVLLVTIDGRQAGFSEGASIAEAADVMAALGARRAMNLDGGGSTAMALRGGALVNSPSDAAGQRSLGNALLVVPRS